MLETDNEANTSKSFDACSVKNVFELQEYKQAMLEMQAKYANIIKLFQNNIQDNNIDVRDENAFKVQSLEDENEDLPFSIPSSYDGMFKAMVHSELEKQLKGDQNRPELARPKEETTDVYKTFLDRHRKSCKDSKNQRAEYSEEQFVKNSEATNGVKEKVEDETPGRPHCQNNYFELVSNRQTYNTYMMNFPNELLQYHLENLNNFLFCPLLFPTKDGQLYYQNFIRCKKYSGQYSNKLYGYIRKTINAFTNVKTKKNDSHKRSGGLDFFNAMNRYDFEPHGKLKILDLLCTILQNQNNMKVVKIEHAKLTYTHGIAVLMAINLERVETLFMYDFFDKDVELFESDHYEANTREDVLDIIKKYEFKKYVNKLNDQEHANTDCKISNVQALLSSCVQITNNKTNNDKNKSKINKCCFLDTISEFTFSESPSALEHYFNAAIAENKNSLKFLNQLYKIKSIGPRCSLNLILYKYCLTMACNLKFLSCNYQYLTDMAGDVLNTISNYKTLECLQLFIEPPNYPLKDALNIKIISNETWINCKKNCPGLRTHFIITGLLFDVAEQFITKDIPLYSIHISSGALIPKVEHNIQLLHLLEILMHHFERTLQAVSITVWKHNFNEDLDMVLINLFKKLEHLQIMEYAGPIRDLCELVDSISKVKHGCVKRIILRVNNHSKHDISQVYYRYCSTFQSDNIAFTLVSLNI